MLHEPGLAALPRVRPKPLATQRVRGRDPDERGHERYRRELEAAICPRTEHQDVHTLPPGPAVRQERRGVSVEAEHRFPARRRPQRPQWVRGALSGPNLRLCCLLFACVYFVYLLAVLRDLAGARGLDLDPEAHPATGRPRRGSREVVVLLPCGFRWPAQRADRPAGCLQECSQGLPRSELEVGRARASKSRHSTEQRAELVAGGWIVDRGASWLAGRDRCAVVRCVLGGVLGAPRQEEFWALLSDKFETLLLSTGLERT